MAAIRQLNGRVVLPVSLLDNSTRTLLIEPTQTVQEVCRSMAEKIGFSDPEDDSLCFSLNECLDGVTIGRALPGDKEVLGVMESWFGKPEARFIFQCKLYTDGIIASKDPKITHMLFIQGVYNVISGTYPTAEKDAVQLAAYQFQAKFGAHNPASHKVGFLTSTIVEYIPGTHLESAGKTAQQWEELIFHKHAFSTTKEPKDAYCGMLAKRDYYGCVLFAVKQKYDRAFPRRLYLGISRRGIVLLRIPKTQTEGDMETLARFPLADIYRWAYKPGVNFYFEIKAESEGLMPGMGEGNPVYTFDTPEGKHMSDMLTDYALALLREMGLNPDGSKRIREKVAESVALPPEPIASPGKTAMAATSEAYSAVAGDVGLLASAATRSGVDEAKDDVPPPPPPPPAAEPASADEEALPANWIKVLDESSGDHYFFNTVTGDSVWERSEIPE